jgi:hypothetical protein
MMVQALVTQIPPLSESIERYDQQIASLAFKWIRIIFRCRKTRTPYDETIYCKSLQLRGSSLAVALATKQLVLT